MPKSMVNEGSGATCRAWSVRASPRVEFAPVFAGLRDVMVTSSIDRFDPRVQTPFERVQLADSMALMILAALWDSTKEKLEFDGPKVTVASMWPVDPWKILTSSRSEIPEGAVLSQKAVDR